MVERIHGDEAAVRAEAHFRRVVQRKEVPEDVPEVTLSLQGAAEVSLLEALDRIGLVASRSEGRRLVSQGAVALEGERVNDALLPLAPGTHLLRVGKRRFARLLLKS